MTPRSVQIWFQNRRQRLKPTNSKQGSDSPSSLPRQRQSSGPTPQQQIGMPGLAAVAGLCNSYASESLLMSKAMSQLPLGQASSGLGSFVNGIPYDVMEPFAATKALLGAGYQPPSSLSLASRLSQQPQGSQNCMCSSALAAAMRRGEDGSHGATAGGAMGAADPSSYSTAGASTKVPQADGLLLLLACADAAASSAPSAEAVATAPSVPAEQPAVVA